MLAVEGDVDFFGNEGFKARGKDLRQAKHWKSSLAKESEKAQSGISFRRGCGRRLGGDNEEGVGGEVTPAVDADRRSEEIIYRGCDSSDRVCCIESCNIDVGDSATRGGWS